MLTFIGSKHSSMAKVKQIPLCLLSPKWYLGKIFKKIRIYSTIADLVKPMFEWNRPESTRSGFFQINANVLFQPAGTLPMHARQPSEIKAILHFHMLQNVLLHVDLVCTKINTRQI
jgi:hypothetical protein